MILEIHWIYLMNHYKPAIRRFFSMKLLLALVTVPFFGAPLLANSYYPTRPDDPRAVYLTAGDFSVHANGIADDSEVLQTAINRVQEAHFQGILFVPSGRYRISKTIYIWPGIRVIGYGQTRPVFVLGANTPGYQQGPTYMMFFAGGRPGADRSPRAAAEKGNGTPPDANPGTFYSAMSNI